jgi:hypothetical protein
MYEIKGRRELIKWLLENYDYKSYLEIGFKEGGTFFTVNLLDKIGIDPNPQRFGPNILKMTSDDYFEQCDRKFDIIYIDGLHEAHQVLRDVNNSLAHLNEGGTIIMHDCNPRNEINQSVPRVAAEWNGDAWKTFVLLRTRHDIDLACGNFDYGNGVIRVRPNGSILQIPYTKIDELKWSDFSINRNEWLRLMNANDLLNWIKS